MFGGYIWQWPRDTTGSHERLRKFSILPDPPGESYHVIRGTADVTDSRHGYIISPATEKLKKQDKLQPRDKS